MIHRFDYGTPIEETMEALDELVGALARPGEKPIAGTIRPKTKEEIHVG